MSFSPETRRLLEALRRGEIVSVDFSGGWSTSGGDHVEGKSVYVLVRAGLAEYTKWGTASTGNRIGTEARLKPLPAKEAA